MKKIILATTILYGLSTTQAEAIYRYDFKSKKPTIEINLQALKYLKHERIASRPASISRGSVAAPAGTENTASIATKPRSIPQAKKPVEGTPWQKEKAASPAPAAKPKMTAKKAPKEPEIVVDVPPPPPSVEKKAEPKKPSPKEQKAKVDAERKAKIEARKKAAQEKRKADMEAKKKAAQEKRKADMEAKKKAEMEAKKQTAGDKVSSLPPLAPPPPPPGNRNARNNLPEFDEQDNKNDAGARDSAALPSLNELFGEDEANLADDSDRIIVPPSPPINLGAVPAPPPAPKVGKPEIETVMIKPQELPKISLPSFSEDTPYLSVPFAEAEVDFPVSEQANLLEIIERMKTDDSLVVKVVAFASGTDEQASQAKRTALARALSVRKIFKERDIASERMIIRPLGNKAKDGVPDRVDIFLSKKDGA